MRPPEIGHETDPLSSLGKKLAESRRALSLWDGPRALASWKEAEALRATLQDVPLPGYLQVRYDEMASIFANWERPLPAPTAGILERIKNVLLG